MRIADRLTAALADRYRIERELGAGGMATVYLADDLKHDRKVAVKVLKPDLAAVVGAERFLAEIRTTANLQHPHILPLFDSGEADSFLFYVMPYVEGETLREKIDREKQLSVPEAIAITVKIAGALQSAHDQGIIHRDIKPGNILLQNGEPVVADFGIALAVRQAGEGRITETGLSLGTPYYMAPEQATGDRDPDQRSDLYSLACMLYEMLTGDPPFTGSTAQAVLGRILTEPPPDVTRARPTVPPHVGAVLARALQKLPADRFESVAEFSRALQNEGYVDPAARASGAWAAAQRGGSAWQRRLPWGVAALMALVAAGAIAVGIGSTDDSGPSASFRSSLDVSDLPRIDGFINEIRISDDGTRLLWIGNAFNDQFPIHVRGPADERFRPLSGTSDASGADLSPDGESVIFGRRSDPGLYRVTFDGSEPRRIAEVDGDGVYFIVWGNDNSVVFTAPSPSGETTLYRVAASGGSPERLATVDLIPTDLLPDGRGVLGTTLGGPGNVALHVPGEDSLRVLASDAQRPRYVEPGYLLFVTPGGDLLAQRFDLGSLTLEGDAKPILGGIQSAAFYPRYDVADNGTLVFGSGPSLTGAGPSEGQLALVDLDGNRSDLTLPPRDIGDVRWSPDGRRVAFSGAGPDAGEDAQPQVWIFDTEVQNEPMQLTGLGGHSPVWSPDGRAIAFASLREGTEGSDIFRKAVDSDGSAELVWSAPAFQNPSDWPTPDTMVIDDGTPSRITLLTAAGDTSTYLATPRSSRDAVVSPNGRWIAYHSAADDEGIPQVYVRSYPEAGAAIRISQSEAYRVDPMWAPDGRTLYYVGPDSVYAAELGLEPTLRPARQRALFARNGGSFDLHPEGDRFIASYPARSGPLDAETGDERPYAYHVITNWFTDLERAFADEGGR